MISYLELFSGIGGFRKALELVAKDFNLDTKCIGFSEIDKYAITTYKSNFSTEGEVEMGDITTFTENKSNIEELPNFSFLMAGFPCQSFSMMGKQLGLEDKRGNLFYRIIDILAVKQPNFILLENVKNLKSHDNGATYKHICQSLRDLGYIYQYSDIFNTANFSLAQTRNRLYIFASKVEMLPDFKFSAMEVMNHFKTLNGNSSVLRQKNVLDVLDKNVDRKYYLSDKIKPTILSNGTKNFVSKSEINPIIARPLTATMVKMHRACQDNYYSDDFLLADDPYKVESQNLSKEDLAKQNIRKITPKEALAFQGFDNSFYQNARDNAVSEHQIYRQAGNAVSVNTVYAILYHLFVKYKINTLVP